MLSIILTTLYTCSVSNWSSLDESNSSILLDKPSNNSVIIVNEQNQIITHLTTHQKTLHKKLPKSRNRINKI